MMRRAALALLAALLPGAAQAMWDPLEPVNRAMHGFNAEARAWAFDPAIAAWRAHVPEGLRVGLGQAVANLGEPVSAVSALAAGEWAIAGNAVTRFAINTTLGRAGWRDAAAERGLERQAMTPGEALCAWGVPSGPYLVLPLLGPSTLRDAAATAALGAAVSAGIGAAPVAAQQGAEALVGYDSARESLARLETGALDPYAALRSVLAQRRAARCATDRVED